ncbi:hypothetical protein MSP8886_03379 [Marinomonas spartinae]|uniref:UPF0311 protein MSP8886_03379 n=1 Tax=Marinomonas spartinae TaxID=1792290 RepID=A0A1A8TR99_9GAMM|nr:DUF3237 domain-containing protein [Marinomonas spartinae]SBS35410.1 hypothetical protein MSP8886_03379 [Marinomonas spartinae]
MINAPTLNYFATLEIEVAEPQEIGKSIHGERRIIPILGGNISGQNWQGKVLLGGADYQLIATPRLALLDAHYTIETNQGECIYVHNSAIRVASPEVTQQIKKGEPVDPQQVYFRCAPKFETSAERFQWITERLFIGVGVRKPTLVELTLFEVG